MAFAIFSPIVGHVLESLVDEAIGTNANLVGNNGENLEYYQLLDSAKTLTVGFFNLFGYIMTVVILVWATLQSLRREEDTYAG